MNAIAMLLVMNFPLTIIIPTHKRANTLRHCLDCIDQQTILKPHRSRKAGQQQKSTLEVIVVSDGPDTKTDDLMVGLEWRFDLQYFSIPKSQQGVARNEALQHAHGDYVLFVNDDIFLAPDACEKHLSAHERLHTLNHELGNKKEEVAVLGHITWDPSLEITPLMKWMEGSGVQFGYDQLAAYAHGFVPPDRQHWYTYTGNISISTRMLHKHRFSEDVSLYGWEDIEWGLRLAQADISLFYESDARGWHHHVFTTRDVQRRSFNLGQSAVQMERLLKSEQQEVLQLIPRGWKRIVYWCVSWLPTYRGMHYRWFLRGVRREEKRV